MAIRCCNILLGLFLASNLRQSLADSVSEPTDVLFLIDGSGSVKPHNFDKLRVLLKNIVDSLSVGPDGANVALIQFSSRELTKVEFNLDTFDNKDDIKKAIDDMIYQRKYTYTGYAMEMAREKVFNGKGGDRPYAKNVLLLFTDGEAADPHIARAESKDLKESGAHVISVGFGPKKSVARFKEEMEVMASSKEDDVFLREFDDLDDIERRIVEVAQRQQQDLPLPCQNGATYGRVGRGFGCICTEDYEGLLCDKKKDPCSKEPCLNGGKCQKDGEDFQCICSRNFVGKQCEKEKVVCTTRNADILFILDGSRSIKDSDFQKMKSFVTELVYRFNISRQESHVSLIQFSNEDRTMVEFYLDDYFTKSSIMKKIESLLSHKGGYTYTGTALKVAREQVFNGKRGDRKDIRDVVILLTDGQAHRNKEAILEAGKLKDDDVSIISIGVGKGENVKKFYALLEGIASDPDYVFKVSFSELETILNGVIKAACENLRNT